MLDSSRARAIRPVRLVYSIVVLGIVVTAARADSPPADANLDPIADQNPGVVSVRLITKIASRARPLDRFIDPDAGILLIHYEDYDGYDHLDKRAKRLCGGDAKTQLARIRKDIARTVETVGVQCQNQPEPVCIADGDEFNPQVTYYFGRTARGVVLQAISFISTNGPPESFKKRARRFVADERARAAREPCQRAGEK